MAIGAAIGTRTAVGSSERPTPQPEYLTAEVTRGNVVAAVAATGTIKAIREVKVGSQLSGQISELLADFNDKVTAGQPIARLDPRTQEARVREGRAALRVAGAKVMLNEAAIAQTEAELAIAGAKLSVVTERLGSLKAKSEEAKRRLGRVGVLRDRGTASESSADQARMEYDSAEALLRSETAQLAVERASIVGAEANVMKAKAELEDAKAALERQQALLSQAEIELSRTVIRAPVDGVIIGRKVDQGQTVAASLEAPVLFEIARDLSAMEVHIRVDEADIGQVQLGQQIAFTVDAHPQRSFSGKVTQLRKSPEVINNVVIYTVVCSADNPQLLLLPGMTATVRIIVAEAINALHVPNAALRFRPAGAATVQPGPAPLARSADSGAQATVWVVNEDKAVEAVQFSLGPTDGRSSVVRDGPLKAGDRVAVGMVRAPQKSSNLWLRLGF